MPWNRLEMGIKLINNFHLQRTLNYFVEDNQIFDDFRTVGKENFLLMAAPLLTSKL